MEPKPKTRIIIILQDKLARLIRVTAYLQATVAYTEVKEAKSENIIEWGLSAVTQTKLLELVSDDTRIEAFKNELTKKYLAELKKKTEAGPKALLDFIDELERKKRIDQEVLNNMYHRVVKSSKEVTEVTSTAIKITATLKFASTVTNSILSNFAPPAGFLITLAQDTAMEFCNSLSEANEADMVAVLDATETAGWTGVGDLRQEGVSKLMENISEWTQKRHYDIYKEIRGKELKVTAKEAFERSNQRFTKSFRATEKTSKFLGKESGITLFKKKIPGLSIIFTGEDIIDAWSQFQEEIK